MLSLFDNFLLFYDDFGRIKAEVGKGVSGRRVENGEFGGDIGVYARILGRLGKRKTAFLSWGGVVCLTIWQNNSSFLFNCLCINSLTVYIVIVSGIVILYDRLHPYITLIIRTY